MMRAARDLKPRLLVTIGDFADFYAVSSHSKDPKRALTLESEITAVNAKLDELDALGARDKIFIEGNHCDRLLRYLRDRAPELFDVVSTPALFRLAQRGWQHIPYRQYTKRGALYLTHDVGSSGRNSVFRSLETFKHSVVTGHSHRFAYIVEGDATGEHRVSAQFGWLGDAKQVDYLNRVRAMKDWALGFGVGYYDRATGYVYLTPIPIVKYTCVVNGKLYR